MSIVSLSSRVCFKHTVGPLALLQNKGTEFPTLQGAELC